MTTVLDDIRSELLETRRKRARRAKKNPYIRPPSKAKKRGPMIFAAVDGEGRTLPNAIPYALDRHIYTELSVVLPDGTVVGEIANAEGLSTLIILEFLTTLKHENQHVDRLFGFSLGYDHACWFRELTERDLYRLPRVNPKSGKGYWIAIEGPKARYSVQQTGRELKIMRYPWNPILGDYATSKDARRCTTVSDIFKFFQSSAVKAYADWKIFDDPKYADAALQIVGSNIPGQHAQVVTAFIADMKARRDSLHEVPDRLVRLYNQVETQGYADLAAAVTGACSEAGIKLKNWHGAGSIAKAMLDVINVRDFMPEDEVWR